MLHHLVSSVQQLDLRTEKLAAVVGVRASRLESVLQRIDDDVLQDPWELVRCDAPARNGVAADSRAEVVAHRSAANGRVLVRPRLVEYDGVPRHLVGLRSMDVCLLLSLERSASEVPFCLQPVVLLQVARHARRAGRQPLSLHVVQSLQRGLPESREPEPRQLLLVQLAHVHDLEQRQSHAADGIVIWVDRVAAGSLCCHLAHGHLTEVAGSNASDGPDTRLHVMVVRVVVVQLGWFIVTG